MVPDELRKFLHHVARGRVDIRRDGLGAGHGLRHVVPLIDGVVVEQGREGLKTRPEGPRVPVLFLEKFVHQPDDRGRIKSPGKTSADGPIRDQLRRTASTQLGVKEKRQLREEVERALNAGVVRRGPGRLEVCEPRVAVPNNRKASLPYHAPALPPSPKPPRVRAAGSESRAHVALDGHDQRRDEDHLDREAG